MLISFMWGILSHRVRISKHHDVHVNYLTLLFVSYTSIKLGAGVEEKKTHKNVGRHLNLVCFLSKHLILKLTTEYK